ncbi:hypothetical protein ACU4GD_14185 [Cupriavidus basilensis]
MFSLQASGEAITDISLGKIVRERRSSRSTSEAQDMSPRVLRNTYCRRLLLAGRNRDEVSKLLGAGQHANLRPNPGYHRRGL